MCVCAKLLQLCPTLCDPMDHGLPGSSVRGILQQEYWSGLPCPPPGIFPTQGSNTWLLCLLNRQAGSLPLAPLALNKSCLQLCNKVHLQPPGAGLRGAEISVHEAHMDSILCRGGNMRNKISSDPKTGQCTRVFLIPGDSLIKELVKS